MPLVIGLAGTIAVVACDKPPVGTLAALLEHNQPSIIMSDGLRSIGKARHQRSQFCRVEYSPVAPPRICPHLFARACIKNPRSPVESEV